MNPIRPTEVRNVLVRYGAAGLTDRDFQCPSGSRSRRRRQDKLDYKVKDCSDDAGGRYLPCNEVLRPQWPEVADHHVAGDVLHALLTRVRRNVRKAVDQAASDSLEFHLIVSNQPLEQSFAPIAVCNHDVPGQGREIICATKI